MKTVNQKQIVSVLLKILIGAQVLIGFFLVLFSSFGQGLLLWGSAALIYLGTAVLEQLSSLRELLTYSVFKQGDLKQSTSREPQEVVSDDAETPGYPARPTAPARRA